MPWYFPWSESIKKRACRYLLQHYLGDFLKEKLTLDQLTVDLYNGKGTVLDVPLDVWALNEMFECMGIPLQLIDGYIGSISVAVPWMALLNDSCQIEISGLDLTLTPRVKAEPGGMFDSAASWNSMSMTTSMQLAQECLKQEASMNSDADNPSQSFEGLEAFAQTIESVLSRIKVSFVNTNVRLEHIPSGSNTGVGLELHIDRIEFSDTSNAEVFGDSQPQHTIYEPVAVAIKNLDVIGLELYMDEFPESKRTRHRVSQVNDSEPDPLDGESLTPILNESLRDYMDHMPDQSTKNDRPLLPQVQILGSCGRHHIKAKLKQAESLIGPKVDVEYNLGALNIFLTPRQLHLIIGILSVFEMNAPEEKVTHQNKKSAYMRAMKDDDYKVVEESLQQQIGAARIPLSKSERHHSIDLQSAVSSLSKPLDKLPGLSLGSPGDSEDEFFSMNDFSLPALSQPPNVCIDEDINVHNVNQHNSILKNDTKQHVSNLGSAKLSTNLLAGQRKASLTEQASTVFKASSSNNDSSNDTQRKFQGKRLSSHSSGLASLADMDDSSKTFHVKIKASQVFAILLHRDPFLGKTDQDDSMRSTNDHNLLNMSEEFFQQIGKFSMQNLFDGDTPKEELMKICPYDHLRFVMSVVSIESEAQTLSNWHTSTFELIIGKLALDESLYDLPRKRHHANFALPYTQTKLVHFQNNPYGRTSKESGFSSAPAPCLKVKIEQVKKRTDATVTLQSRPALIPKSSVLLTFEPVVMEIDITILDRLNSLIKPEGIAVPNGNQYRGNPKLLSSYMSASMNKQTAFNQAMEDSPLHGSQSHLDIEATCSHLTLLLKFPIPDLRAASDIDKRPWWRKALRQESMTFEVIDSTFKTVRMDSIDSSCYEFIFRKAQGYFCLSATDIPLHVLSIGNIPANGNGSNSQMDWSRIVITNNATVTRSVFEEEQVGNSLDSQFDSLEDNYPWLKSSPSPFASKPVMYETEELVMPGSLTEMQQFQAVAQENAKMCVTCHFQQLDINLQTKDVFELFYNRLVNDLLMWEPSAPEPLDTLNQVASSLTTGSVHINLRSHMGLANDNFVLCRSAIKDAYDSDSDHDMSSTDPIKSMDTATLLSGKGRQSAFCFKLSTNHGSIALFPTVTENKDKDIEQILSSSDEHKAHVIFQVDDANFCIVSGFEGNDLLDYMNLYASNATMHHGNIDCHGQGFDLSNMRDSLSTNGLHCTIFPYDDQLAFSDKDNLNGETASMLSIALKMRKTIDSNRKEHVLALGISGGTLSHRVLPSEHGWLSLLSDYMSVNDIPVLGYTPPIVVTVLHAHLIDCTIEYRPLHLPINTMITFDSFSVSSNIVAGSMTSLLRFIIQDSQVWLGKNACNVDDLVPVIDMELFELSLRLTDGTDARHPKFDLNMSSNILNIRTCSDSCSALLSLIKYYAGDGDLQEHPIYNQHQHHQQRQVQQQTSVLSSSSFSEYSSTSEPALSPTVAPDDMVGSLMADAMRESNRDTTESNDRVVNEIGDYSVHDSMTSSNNPKGEDRYFQSTLIDYHRGEEKHDDSSGDEYCILEQESEEEDTSNQEPQVRVLSTDSEPTLIDNYFVIPLGRYDQLSAPFGFPTAVYKYTLREMTIVWQMYAGRDFASTDGSESPSKTNRSACEVRRQRARWQLERTLQSRRSRSKDGSHSSIRCQGGVARDGDMMMELHLNKIRFQHEVYPDNTYQSGRDILLIYDVELLDRCKASRINKFLYRYSSENVPKQSNANMFMAKVLFTRPEDMVRKEEASVRVSLQPLRFNIDQGALFFLRDFFTEISTTSTRDEIQPPHNDFIASTSVSQTQPPEMTSPTSETSANEIDSRHPIEAANTNVNDNGDVVFIRSFVFSPEVPIRFDYHGKRVELDQRTLPALLMGLAQLSCSELKLRRLHCRSGLLGFDRLCHYAIKEWLDDVRRNQLSGILGGVGPTYSLVQLFQGVRDLFVLPVQQYRQDGRWMRGIQRGAHSFSSSTAMAVLDLSNRLVMAVQAAAETAFDMVSPSFDNGPISQAKSRSNKQPADFREGVTNAYSVLSEGIANAAGAIAKVATEEHERRGVTGAVGGVLRQIPPTVVQPFILATEATSNVLGGALNQLAPDARREAIEKWKAGE